MEQENYNNKVNSKYYKFRRRNTSFGKDIKQNEKEIKSKLGVVLDDSFLSEYLTPKKINSIMKDFIILGIKSFLKSI